MRRVSEDGRRAVREFVEEIEAPGVQQMDRDKLAENLVLAYAEELDPLTLPGVAALSDGEISDALRILEQRKPTPLKDAAADVTRRCLDAGSATAALALEGVDPDDAMDMAAHAHDLDPGHAIVYGVLIGMLYERGIAAAIDVELAS